MINHKVYSIFIYFFYIIWVIIRDSSQSHLFCAVICFSVEKKKDNLLIIGRFYMCKETVEDSFYVCRYVYGYKSRVS